MSAERNASGASALLLSLDVKFVKTFQKIVRYWCTLATITLSIIIEIYSNREDWSAFILNVDN